MAFYDDNTPDETVPAGPQFGSADYNFDFLDNYIKGITAAPKTNPDQDVDDNQGFFDEADNEEQDDRPIPPAVPVDENGLQTQDGDYTFSDNSDATQDGDSQNLDYLLYNSDNLDYSNIAPDSTKFAGTIGGGTGDLKNQISKVESQGKYTATNPNSSATGKYQFLWSKWGDSIKKVTGVKTQAEFLKNPAAQEKYYSFYENSYLKPGITTIRKNIKTDLTDTQLGKLIHFRGEAGAEKYLKGQLKDKPESYNMKISDYIKQTGGVASTPQQQYVGLNDPSLDHLFMPLQGINTIRGLDDGSPVEVTDESGNKKILYGPKHTFKAKGKVFEKRIKN